MYKRILVATDGSELSQRAAEQGIGLAKRLGASIVAVYASPPFETPAGFEFVPAPLLPVDAYTQSTREAAQRYLGSVSASAERAGVPCKVKHFRSLTPAEAIVSVAETEKCDLVVVGSHGRGALGQLWLGSVTTRVLATSSVPVLVCRVAPKTRRSRKADTAGYRRILVCTDGSPLATLATQHAVGLAKKLDARLVALYITPPFQPPEGFETSPMMPAIRKYVADTQSAARRHLGAVARLAESANVRCETRHIGGFTPARLIVETAQQERCDLVVMGSHGRDRVGRILLGSVTSRVIETSAIPVLVLRPARERAKRKAAVS